MRNSTAAIFLLVGAIFIACVQRLVPVDPIRGATNATKTDTKGVTDCESCPEMIAVGPGAFVMGSPKTEKYRGPNEDQVSVVIGYSFYIGKYPITVEQFSAFASETGYDTPSDCYVYGSGPWSAKAHWRSPTFKQSGTHPVTCVSWSDARAYASWLSKKTGKSYRLPSEAEFEYVARGGTETPFWFGKTMNGALGRYVPASNNILLWPFISWEGGTASVTDYPANPWGVSGVNGNAWEITEDCWSDVNAGNPGNGRPRTSGDCARRAVRGGAWDAAWFNCRSANRHYVKLNERFYNRGFRLVRE